LLVALRKSRRSTDQVAASCSGLSHAYHPSCPIANLNIRNGWDYRGRRSTGKTTRRDLWAEPWLRFDS